VIRLICLATSKRPDGWCIAGIDYDTGEWLRPVPRDGDAVPDRRCLIDGRFLAPLDGIGIELAQPKDIPKYQRENRFIKNWSWCRLGRFRRVDLQQYCDETVPILHSLNDRVLPAILERLTPDRWKSLQLVMPRKLTFERDLFDQHRWRARFRDRARNEYYLKITDPVVTRRLEAGAAISANSLLTISLTKPWAPPDGSKPEHCYKLVAAVIEL
jgi:hypothetical protein